MPATRDGELEPPVGQLGQDLGPVPDRLAHAAGDRGVEAQPHVDRWRGVGRPDPPRVGEELVRVEVVGDLVSVDGQHRLADALDLVGPHRARGLVVADEIDAAPRGGGLEEVRTEARLPRLAGPGLVGDLDHAALGPAPGDGVEDGGERLVRVLLAHRQHGRRHVAGDGLWQLGGDLGERADDRLIRLVGPLRDEARREKQDDALRDGQVERRQEVLLLDPEPAAPGLEDRDRQLVLQGLEVAIDGSLVHPGQAGDVVDRDPLLAAAAAVQDGDHRQQAGQPVPLPAGAGQLPGRLAVEGSGPRSRPRGCLRHRSAGRPPRQSMSRMGWPMGPRPRWRPG